MTSAPASLAATVGVSTRQVGQLVARLADREWTVAAAESLTGGLLTALLTEIPGSSAVVRGGVVVYATELKHTLAGVDADLLARHGAVHPEVAAALAVGARQVCGAVLGLGLTGVAGPDPQDGRAPGTYFVALAGPETDRITVVAGPVPVGPSDDPDPQRVRAGVRGAAVRTALNLLTDRLTDPA